MDHDLESLLREDLLRYMDEYGWEPRITTKLLNLRHGLELTAEDIKTLYGRLRSHTEDPDAHLLNLEQRRWPGLPDD